MALAREDGVTVVSTLAANEAEVLGVNSQQLAQLEWLHQLAIAEKLMVQGVRLPILPSGRAWGAELRPRRGN